MFQLWENIHTPTTGEPVPIGSYSAGCLLGAKELRHSGITFAVMHPERKRNFGHPQLVAYIENLAKQVHENHLGVLLVGDMGRPRGGPMISGHTSHQTGLDVDLWYLLPSKSPKRSARSTLNANHYTSAGKIVHWSPKQTKLLQLAVDNPIVDRIFVNPVIKQSLCQSEHQALWLHKLRPWWGHDDHFHVRLTCPSGANQCQAMDPIPEGSGCGTDLAWWFGEDAMKALAERGAKERKFPTLPALCNKLTTQ